MTAKTRLRVRGTVLIVFTIACIGIFLLLLNISGGLRLGSYYNFQAVVPTSVQLVQGGDVREAGVNVGKVTGISNRGDSAVVSMSLSKKYGPVYHNGTVQVRTKTLVGENYVDLDPGTPSAGAIAAGGLLPISQAQDAVQLDQLLSTMPPARRARLQRLLHGFGDGLRAEAANVNDTLDALSDTVNNAGPVAQTLAGQSQQLASLVDDLGSVFAALGNRATAIHELATDGLQTANAFASQDAAVSQTLRELPGTLTTAQATTAHLASVGTAAIPVLDNLTGALTALTPALQALPRAGAATLSALDRLHAVTPIASGLLDSLRTVAPTVTSDVPPLTQVLDQLNPFVSYLTPYTNDAAHLLYMMSSAGQGSDATGELGDIVPMVASSTLATLSPAEKQLLQALQSLGVAQVLNTSGVNQYPAPGTASAPAPFTGSYPRVNALSLP